MKTLTIENKIALSKFSEKISGGHIAKHEVVYSTGVDKKIILGFCNENVLVKKAILFGAIFSMLFILFTAALNAQNSSDITDKYRVTAYQKGKNQVVSLSNEVEIIPAAVYYIPNAFTPNGDGLNETFGIIGEGITEYEMQIFNRWGNLIFESKEQKNQWDGTFHNDMAPTGTYVYKIIGKGPSGEGKIQRLINVKGHVTLVL